MDIKNLLQHYCVVNLTTNKIKVNGKFARVVFYNGLTFNLNSHTEKLELRLLVLNELKSLYQFATENEIKSILDEYLNLKK